MAKVYEFLGEESYGQRRRFVSGHDFSRVDRLNRIAGFSLMSLTLSLGNTRGATTKSPGRGDPKVSPGWSVAEPWGMFEKEDVSPGGAAHRSSCLPEYEDTSEHKVSDIGLQPLVLNTGSCPLCSFVVFWGCKDFDPRAVTC
jgi:hypothetical protein